MDFNEDTQKLATTTRCYAGLIVVIESIRIFNIEIFILPTRGPAKTCRDWTVEVEDVVILLNEE